LKYEVLGLDDLLAERSTDIDDARKQVRGDFHSPRLEQEIQCGGYGDRHKNQYLFFTPETLAKFRRK